jgi:hypothetical protein
MMNFRLVCLLACVNAILFTAPLLHAQQQGNPHSNLVRMHHEAEDHPYLPNQWHNRKQTPAYRFSKPASGQANRSAGTASTIFTVQVNVDPATGQNITGDAANEPSITRSEGNPGVMVIGWRQFDNILSNFRQAGWAYTTDSGLSWTFPGVIDPGIFRSDPVLDHDADGAIYYNSLTNSPTYMCKVFRSDDGGVTWDAGTDAAGGDKQWMAIDRSSGPVSNNIYSFWTDDYSSCNPDAFTRSPDNGVGYEPCTSIPGAPALGTMTVDRNGVLYVAGVSDSVSDFLVVKSLNAQFDSPPVSWEPYVQVSLDGWLNGWAQVNPVGLYGQVNIDVDRSNGPGQDNVYILAPVMRSSNGDPSDIMFSRSTDGGLTWSPAVRINDDNSVNNTQWFGTMSVAPNGRIDVIWLDTREDSLGLDMSALYYSFSTDQGVTWSANEKLSPEFDPHVGYPMQMKMGDYFDMESDSLGAHLAWAGTFNGEQDVYYSYIQPPVSTGIQSVPARQAYSVFPNPCRGILYLKGPAHNTKVDLYSVQGQLLFSIFLSGYRNTLDISALPSGMYFLNIRESDGRTFTKKVVRE